MLRKSIAFPVSEIFKVLSLNYGFFKGVLHFLASSYERLIESLRAAAVVEVGVEPLSPERFLHNGLGYGHI